ncbi:hypothetical protein Hanom_Chr15g01379831 [Helianthus anomalus]
MFIFDSFLSTMSIFVIFLLSNASKSYYMLVGKTVTVDSRVNAFQSLHGKALVARMIDLQAVKNIKIILNDICPGQGRVQYLGGLDVMVSFDDAETAVAVREAAKSVVGKFSLISIWEGQTLGFERLAWLKVQGSPLYLLSNEVIDAVGGVFGKVVHKANCSERDHDLSFEYGILVGEGKRVSEEVVLNWKGQKFRVWVMEELGEWTPEFTEEKTHHVVEASETGDDESDDSEDEQSSEVEPEKTNNSGEEVNVHVEPVVLEKIGCNNDCNYGNQSRPLNDPVGNSVRDTEEFTRAVNFPFDQFLKENNCPTVSKVNKRKKIKKGDMGRPSKGYTSSQESLKINKRSRNDDLFGLDSLLGLNKSVPYEVGDVSGNVDQF